MQQQKNRFLAYYANQKLAIAAAARRTERADTQGRIDPEDVQQQVWLHLWLACTNGRKPFNHPPSQEASNVSISTFRLARYARETMERRRRAGWQPETSVEDADSLRVSPPRTRSTDAANTEILSITHRTLSPKALAEFVAHAAWRARKHHDPRTYAADLCAECDLSYLLETVFGIIQDLESGGNRAWSRLTSRVSRALQPLKKALAAAGFTAFVLFVLFSFARTTGRATTSIASVMNRNVLPASPSTAGQDQQPSRLASVMNRTRLNEANARIVDSVMNHSGEAEPLRLASIMNRPVSQGVC